MSQADLSAQGNDGGQLIELVHARAEASTRQETEITLSSTQRNYLKVRYVIDRVLAAILLAVAAPLFLTIAAAVAIDSPGGVFFRQQRVGRGGSLFAIYKFRSLAMETPKYIEKVSPQDPRITRVGRFLRRSAFDELPQLLNVVLGDMALIGPRPEMQFIVELLGPRERQREMIKPGITGWWQIHHRDGVPLHQNIHRDLVYLERVGPLIDLQIVFLTIRVVLSGVVATALPGQHVETFQSDSQGRLRVSRDAQDGSERSARGGANPDHDDELGVR